MQHLDYLTVKGARLSVYIPNNAMFLCHGDFLHAGAAYPDGDALRYFTVLRHLLLSELVELEDPIKNYEGKKIDICLLSSYIACNKYKYYLFS
jgi:hypothetical protein